MMEVVGWGGRRSGRDEGEGLARTLVWSLVIVTLSSVSQTPSIDSTLVLVSVIFLARMKPFPIFELAPTHVFRLVDGLTAAQPSHPLPLCCPSRRSPTATAP